MEKSWTRIDDFDSNCDHSEAQDLHRWLWYGFRWKSLERGLLTLNHLHIMRILIDDIWTMTFELVVTNQLKGGKIANEDCWLWLVVWRGEGGRGGEARQLRMEGGGATIYQQICMMNLLRGFKYSTVFESLFIPKFVLDFLLTSCQLLVNRLEHTFIK